MLARGAGPDGSGEADELSSLELNPGFTGGALGAGAGAMDAAWWKAEFGIPDDFVKQVGAMVQPGDSAIYALLRTASPSIVADQFRGYGGTILSTTLSRDQQAKVENVLHNRAA